ncbi:MAG: hypothetical protein LBG70_03475, partial [Bifidobacteriaceae bacterium]|nr:hypothetical protein [Bifidobacteriaceae bacterium]
MPVRDADALPFAAPTVPLTRQALRQARLRCDDTASFVPPTASFVPPTTSAGRAGACLPPPQLPRLTSRDSAGGVKLAAWLSTSPSPPTSPALPRPHRPNPPVVQRQIQPVPPPPASGVLTRAMLRQARGGPIAVDDAKLASVARPPGRHTAALPVVTPAAPTPVNASSDMAEPTAATTGALPVIAPTADDSFTEYIAARCINFQPLTLPTVEPQTSRSIAQALAQRGVAAGNQLAKAARQLP